MKKLPLIMNKQSLQQKRQQGFTIIEISIALFLGLLIVGAIVTSFGQNKEDTNIGIAKLFFAKNLPEAITGVMMREGSLTTAAALTTSLGNRNFALTTAWNDAVAVTGISGNNVTLTYSLASTTTTAAQLKVAIDSMSNSNIVSTTATNANLLTVVIRSN
ncbi:MAG: hypothetical protein HON94_12480 [Methylococcales bacterium]|nr:hypothetical protein [Methylococcales bacterium]MBT7409886.1 hypothetical protein [Methylococcales bacterium]